MRTGNFSITSKLHTRLHEMFKGKRLLSSESVCANIASRKGVVNPLSPKSDQRQISPCNISALQNRRGHEN